MSISSAVKPYTFTNGTKANATQVNSNFDTVYAGANAAIAALNNAAGSKSSVDSRLDVSMNADGTMKAAITAGGEWINPELTPTYVSKDSFTVTGDQTDIYLADRMLRIVLASSTIYRMVSASTYSAGTDATTVTLVAGGYDVTNPITSVEHGVISPVSSLASSVVPKVVLGYNISTVNIGSTVVARDGGGNFAAGTITAALTGNVTGNVTGTATNADMVDSQHASALAPPGAVMAFAMVGDDPPTGWLKCNGAAVLRSTYSALFSAIGTVWGSGNGSTTFNVPDLRGEFIRGYDDSKGTDPGRVFASSQDDQNAAHTHTVAHSRISGVSAGVNICGGSSPTTDTTTTSSSGGTEARPRNVALLYCIKT